MGDGFMNVFLDSNFCYRDPFMNNNIHNKLLLELAEGGHITLYMSEVVRKEILNNLVKEMRKNIDPIKENETKIRKLLKKGMDPPFEWAKTIEDYVLELDNHLTLLEEQGFLHTVPYSNDILPELVERSIKRIKPFGEKKLEFRDGIIWLSYVAFSKENGLDNCFLLTNNSEDFMKNGELHPELVKDSTAFSIFRSAQDFIQNCKEVRELNRRLDWVEQQDFPQHPEMVLDLIRDQCFVEVTDACASFVNDHSNGIPLPRDVITFDSEWLDQYDISLMKISDIEVSIVLNTIIISGYLTVETYFEIYDRNPMYEPGENEYFCLGGGEAKIYLNFSLTVDEDLDVEDIDFNDIGLE